MVGTVFNHRFADERTEAQSTCLKSFLSYITSKMGRSFGARLQVFATT